MADKKINIPSDKVKKYIENIFNNIIELNKINNMYQERRREDPILWKRYEDTVVDIIYNLIEETAADKSSENLNDLIDAIFNIIEFIRNVIDRMAKQYDSTNINEFKYDSDVISIRENVFTHLVGSSLRDTSVFRIAWGDAYMAEGQKKPYLADLDKYKLVIIDNSLITSAALANKTKVVEVNRSLACFLENVRSWLAFINSYTGKVDATHSIAVYHVGLLHDTTIRLEPIDIGFIDVAKMAALVESLMRPYPLVGYVTGRFFDIFEEVYDFYDTGGDWTREGLNVIYGRAGSVVNKYVNRFLSQDSKISLLGLVVSTLVGDLEIVLPRESMSVLGIYCPANVVLEIDGDRVVCNENLYELIKPPRPWSKKNNIVTFIKLYIISAIDKSSIKILFK